MAVVRGAKTMAVLAQQAGPYVLLELLMPGGTLLALLLFLYQRRRNGGRLPPPIARLARIASRAVDRVLDWSPIGFRAPMRLAPVRGRSG